MEKRYEQGLVSVIIPVFNAQQFIADAIKSALLQTYESIEIIVVDDCSTDDTGAIVKLLQSEHNNINYIRLPHNSGVAVARNEGMKLAKGQYIAFLDADDLWRDTKLKQQIRLLNEKSGAFTFTAIEMIDQENKVVKSKRKIIPEVDYKFLLKNTMIATSSVLLDRNLLGEIKMPIRKTGEDYATWLGILKTGVIAYGIDEALVKYRCGRNDSLSAAKTRNYKTVRNVQMEMGVGKIAASWNTLFYILNAIKKHYL